MYLHRVPVSYPWRMRCTRCITVAYMLCCCGISFLRASYLLRFFMVSLVPVFFVLVKIHPKPTRSHWVSSDCAACQLQKLSMLWRCHGISCNSRYARYVRKRIRKCVRAVLMDQTYDVAPTRIELYRTRGESYSYRGYS